MKRRRNVAFLDFCGAESSSELTSSLYGVAINSSLFGSDAIQQFSECQNEVNENEVDDVNFWNNQEIFLESFQCAKLLSEDGLKTIVVIYKNKIYIKRNAF